MTFKKKENERKKKGKKTQPLVNGENTISIDEDTL